MGAFEAQCNEQIQRISLTKQAYDTICSDSVTFLGKINLSGFTNRIIVNSIDIPLESIDYETTDRTKISKNIRLNNRVFEELYPTNGSWFGHSNYKSPGSYINLLLEKYARQTFYCRESVFFKDFLDVLLSQIESANPQKHILRLTLLSGAQFDFKLLRLSEDYEGTYHYLIGQASETNKKQYRTASFRLSRIKSINLRGANFGSGQIKKTDRIMIESDVKIKGVEYLVGDTQDYLIRLTEAGERMYNSVFHLRPIFHTSYRDEEGCLMISITATKKQIKDYFFKFGKEASILSPESIRKEFFELYFNATMQYNDENQLL